MTKLTRRRLALTALAAPAAAAQAPAAGSQAPADELAKAQRQRMAMAEALRKVRVPITAEPSFTFRP
ncbi:MAG TPA: hypothetical protein VES20_15490 [Bryobacteraceae bacterium]|nr:hypothetical protein [Bryobacteraceae bacterium]